ncbi:MAG: CPBP family glutamic-type intramembrane protease [Microbacterium sp.]|uniref:CPBP family glutamic-type intramembrane protease n=1 Tax=Microbacterium sp. TaxID=51671 RepID=UPI0039E4BFD9
MSVAGPFARPGIAVGVAGFGFVAAFVVTSLYTQLWRPSLLTLPPALLALLDLVIVLAPYVVAVVVAVRWGRGDTGLRDWSSLGILLGLSLGVLARGVTELLVPTTGSLTGAFSVDADGAVVAGLVVSVAGAVVVSPFVEELFFRGVIQRATAQAARPWGPTFAGVVAVALSVVTFVGAHLLVADSSTWPAEIAATLPLGLAAALATAFTRGIGAALVAHVVFNLGGILLLLV